MWPSIWIKDPERRHQKRKKPLMSSFPNGFFFEKSITGPYCTGNFTIADLAMWRLLGWFSEGTLDQVPQDILDSYPKLKVLYRTVGSKPRIQDWMKQYEKEP